MSCHNIYNNQDNSLQISVFTRWINSQLKGNDNKEIKDIFKDLADGVALIQLALILSKKEAPRSWKKEPTRNIDMVQNCDLAIEIFNSDDVQIIGISGKDINDNNEKLILGLIWSLILHYSIQKSIQTVNKEDVKKVPLKTNYRKELIEWANKRIDGHSNIKNFEPYDLAICALIDSYFPDKINFKNLKAGDVEKNVTLANKVMEELGIPIFIYAEDIIKNGNKIDEKTLLTQLSSMKQIFDQYKNKTNEKAQTNEKEQTKEKEQANENNQNQSICEEMKSIETNIKEHLIDILKSSILLTCGIHEDPIETPVCLRRGVNQIYFTKQRDEKFEENLRYWYNHFSDDDLSKIEQKGMTKQNFAKIIEIAEKLYDITSFPIADIEKSICGLSRIHYYDQKKTIKSLSKQLKKIYDECDSPLKNDSILIHHSFKENDPKFNLKNPYTIIPKLCEELAFLSKNSNKIIPKSKFIFSDEFQSLSNFDMKVMQLKVDSNEIDELISMWCTLMKNGFALNQITIEATKDEIIQMKGDGVDVDIQLLLEYNNLWNYFNTIYNYTSELNEQKINQIYYKHLNDELGKLLKPIIENLIPYYKSLITPQGFIKLTVERTEKYKSILQKYWHFEYDPIFPVYLNLIPFKLDSPPDDSYYSLIKNHIANLQLRFSNIQHDVLYNIVQNSLIAKLGTQDLFIDSCIRTQKYFLAWYMIFAIINLGYLRLSYADSSLIFLLLPWKIDDDSDESKKLSNYFRDSALYVVNNCPKFDDYKKSYKYGYRHFDIYVEESVGNFPTSFLLYEWRKYLVKTVIPADSKIDPKKMKREIKKISKKLCDGNYYPAI